MGFQSSPSFRRSRGCDYSPDERKTAVCEALPAPAPSHLLKGAVPPATKNRAQGTSAVRGSTVGWEGRDRQTLSPASLDNLSQGWEAREPTPPQGGPALLQVREAVSTTATTGISAQTPRCPAGLPFHSEQGRPPSSRASASGPGRHSGTEAAGGELRQVLLLPGGSQDRAMWTRSPRAGRSQPCPLAPRSLACVPREA